MYKVYFKQAIALLKQNKFISIVSVTATALAIMMVMVIIVVDHIKNADIAPESNRSSIMYIKQITQKRKDKNWRNVSGLNMETVRELKQVLKSSKLISGSAHPEKVNMSKQNNKLGIYVDCRKTDAEFWQIFDFKFIEGKPLDGAAVNSGINNVVITKSLAEELFGRGNVVGKTVSINRDDFKIVGVVQDVAKNFQNTYAQAWVPFSTLGVIGDGNQQLIMLVEEDKIESLDQECRRYEQQWNKANDEWTLSLSGPFTHWESQFNTFTPENFIKSKNLKRNVTIFFFSILLIIPAINLSGLSLSRVRRRMEEIGIRKAFGAKKVTILIQILYENFITSLLGGIIGLLLSFVMVQILRDWLLKTGDKGVIPVEAFISLPLLLAVVLISFILNLLSSGISAYRAANMKIVDSINQKNN